MHRVYNKKGDQRRCRHETFALGKTLRMCWEETMQRVNNREGDQRRRRL